MRRTKKEKNKIKIALLILVIAIIIIIGSSLALFSDFIITTLSATSGTVTLKEATLYIEQDASGDDLDMAATNLLNWNPGDVTTIKWTVENDGNKSVHTKSTLNISWDVAIDLPEKEYIYLYPYYMTDDEIRDDMKYNDAKKAISMGNDDVEFTTPTNTTQGFEHAIIGDILDGVGLIGAEIGDSIEKNLSLPYMLDDDGETTKDILQMKLAFSHLATNKYQNKSVYINLKVEAVQYRNNELGFYANAEEAMGPAIYTGTLDGNLDAEYKFYENGTLIVDGTGDISTGDFYALSEEVSMYDVKKVIIKEGIARIIGDAFVDMRITDIELPSTLEVIDSYAFNGQDFTTLLIPEGVTSLGAESFANCNNLTTLYIPSTITYMGIETFAWCNNLENVILAEGLTFIGDGMFESCDALTSITLPSTIEYIDEWAFYDSNNLTNINFPNGLTQIKALAFTFCSNLIVPELPDSLEFIGYSAFSGCKPISTLVIKENLKIIQEDAFPDVINLTISSTFDYLGWEAFSNVQNLTIPGNYLESIAMYFPDVSNVIIRSWFYSCK